MSRRFLALKYLLFAALAIVTNIGTQRFVFSVNDSQIAYVIAVFCGTVAGLLLKYFLDKKWIFYDLSSGFKEHGWKFSLYASAGVFTTVIFWGFETIFWLVWKTDFMRELGAFIGLIIGYRIKYDLDYRFVFKSIKTRSKV